MKFLLTALNAKYIHSNPAIYSLRAYVKEYQPEDLECVALAEYTINQSVQEIVADIYEKKPDVIGFSCYIWNWRMVREICGMLCRLLPNLPIWLGGPEVSYDAEQILRQQPWLTGIMVGEGEVTFARLLRCYRQQAQSGCVQGDGMFLALTQIQGLVLRDPADGQIVRSAPRALTDISSLPFYYEDMEDFSNRIVYYESSRGCPFLCSYCLSSIDKTVRLREPSLVEKELQFFLDHKVAQVKFVDRTFNCNREHACRIWQYIREHDNGVTNFHFEIAAELLGSRELELIGSMRPGLIQLEIGVQTTNEKTLEAIRRRSDLKRLGEIVERLRANRNVHVHLDLIAGLPYEDMDSFRQSFNDVYAMAPDQLQLGFLKVLKGSYMQEQAENYGLVYAEEPPYEVLYTKWISYGELLQLKQVEEMVELYYNSGQFTHVLPVLLAQFDTPYGLYEALARFYREKGYFYRSPARAERYRILLDFAETVDQKRSALYRELLTCDMYLRENLKSRPDFAGDLSDHAEKIRAFYRQEEEQRVYLPDYSAYNAKQLQRMTHLEIFNWPVWASPEQALAAFDSRRANPAGTALLFDYQKRSPLDQNARTQIIELE